MSFCSKVIMIIGSSMIQKAYEPEQMGFGIGLSNWYARLADVILRGQSGYNSRWTLMSVKQIIGNHKPDLAVLFLGNNDSSEGGQNVPLDEFKANMMLIMLELRAVNPDMAIILPTPTRASKAGRSDEVTALYADAVKEMVALHPRNALLDLWINDVSIEAADLCDGLHLGITGNAKFLQGLQDTIRASFPEFVPFNDSPQDSNDNHLNWRYPHWNKLAGTTIEEAQERMSATNCKHDIKQHESEL